MKKSKMLYILFALLGAIFMLTACGDDDDETTVAVAVAAPATLPPFNTTCLPLAVAGSGGGYGSFTFDANGDLLFVVNDIDEIRLLDRETCTVTTVATAVSGGNTLLGMTHENPIYVGDDANNIYTVDQTTGTSTLLTTVAGEVDGLVIAPATFGAYGGQLIVAENNGGIYAVDQSLGSPTPVLIVNIGGTASDLIFGSDGTLYVAANTADKIVTVTAAGVVTDFATGLGEPGGLAIDDDGGRLFVAAENNDVLKQVTIPGGVVSTNPVNVDFDDGFWPSQIIYDAEGNLVLMGNGETDLTIINLDL